MKKKEIKECKCAKLKKYFVNYKLACPQHGTLYEMCLKRERELMTEIYDLKMKLNKTHA